MADCDRIGKVDWPNRSKESLRFGVATDLRTYYFHGDDDVTVK